MKALVLLFFAAFALTVQGSCPGCPLEVENLDPEQEALVDWAVLQLQGSEGKCQRTRLGVKDFSTQVVAGALYKFTLQLEHTRSKECAIREETEECKVVVWEKKWLDFKEVQWDQTTCSRN